MDKILVLILLALVTSSFASEEERLEKLKCGIQKYQETRNPPYLTEALQNFYLPHFFRETDPVEPNYGYNHQLKADVTCSVCYLVVNFLLDERRNFNISEDVLALEAAAVCTIFGIESGEVCRGIIDRNVGIFVYMADQNPELKGERICDIILQNTGCSSTTFNWTVDIPKGETVPRKDPSNPENTFTVLTLSDFHYDPLYTPGKIKDCGDPVCCQIDQADGSVEDGTACGYWSEYIHTDASEVLVDEVLRKAKEQKNVDYIYFLGDMISHRVWSTSIENNTRDLKLIFGKIKSIFEGVPVFPILGNHEPSPLNEYAIGSNLSTGLSTEWLYSLLYSEFSEWLPESTQETIMKGGFYTVSPRDGFRIIALNNNVGYTMNWWLINDDVDPYGQLAWLAQTLKQAEDNGEIVHILSHIPSGKSDLLAVWSREYHKIIERFANTISAQFNGHTHHDQFMIQYSSSNTTEPINIAINGASVDCDKSNPNFKYVSVDTSNFDVIDSEEWVFNLTEANMNGNQTPNWYNLYTFREKYGVKSLAPSELGDLVVRMASEHSLLYDYHILRYRNSDLAIESGCNNDCQKGYLCEIAVSLVGDNTQCDWLQGIYDNHISNSL